MDRQNILTIILVLTLIAGGWIWYSYLYGNADNTETTTVESLVSKEFLARASLLDRITIDTSFFINSAFSGLESGPTLPEVQAPNEISGRPNPFAKF